MTLHFCGFSVFVFSEMTEQKQKLHIPLVRLWNGHDAIARGTGSHNFWGTLRTPARLKLFCVFFLLSLCLTHNVCTKLVITVVSSPVEAFGNTDHISALYTKHGVNTNATTVLRNDNSLHEERRREGPIGARSRFPYSSASSPGLTSEKKRSDSATDTLASHSQEEPNGQIGKYAFGSSVFWTYVLICTLLVAFAGVASGLTTGLMSIDVIQLLVLAETGNEKERKRARSVYQLVKKHHLLLVTLLLANSIAMEALPIFLDRLVPSWLAVVLSVTCILFFGEVLPQALCTGPNQLAIASFMAPIVQVLLCLFFILAWPISKALDWALGREDDVYYARSHLKALIGLHQKGRRHREVPDMATTSDAPSSKRSSGLGADEVVVIQGALDMADKRIRDIMVPLTKVYMLEIDTCLTPEILQDILRAGHSRIPVYEGSRHNIRGLLLVKSLIMVDPTAGTPVSEVIKNTEIRRLCTPAFASPDYNPYELLNEFQEGRTHIALVTDDYEEYQLAWQDNRDVAGSARILGIVTLEDVIEELIQEEILDEFDHTCLAQPKKLLVSKGNSQIALRRSLSSSKGFNSGHHTYCSFNPRKCGRKRTKRVKKLPAHGNTPAAAAADSGSEPLHKFDTDISIRSGQGGDDQDPLYPTRRLSVSPHFVSPDRYNDLLDERRYFNNRRRNSSKDYSLGRSAPFEASISTSPLPTLEDVLDDAEDSPSKQAVTNLYTASAPPPSSPSSLSAFSSFSSGSSLKNNHYGKYSNDSRWNSVSNLLHKFSKWRKQHSPSLEQASSSCDPGREGGRSRIDTNKEFQPNPVLDECCGNDNTKRDVSSPYWLMPNEEGNHRSNRNYSTA